MDLTEGYKEMLKKRLTPKRYTHTIGSQISWYVQS